MHIDHARNGGGLDRELTEGLKVCPQYQHGSCIADTEVVPEGIRQRAGYVGRQAQGWKSISVLRTAASGPLWSRAGGRRVEGIDQNTPHARRASTHRSPKTKESKTRASTQASMLIARKYRSVVSMRS